MVGFDAVVLAGGDARRLGGRDKAAIDIGGRSLLDRALSAVRGADRIIAVGPQRATPVPVAWTAEVPAGGGPLRATVAGLQLASSEWVVVLAVDYPLVSTEVVERLLKAAGERDGAVLADAGATPHYVVGAYRTERLRGAIAKLGAKDASMRSLFASLDVEVVTDDAAAQDIDTPEDLERVRAADRA